MYIVKVNTFAKVEIINILEYYTYCAFCVVVGCIGEGYFVRLASIPQIYNTKFIFLCIAETISLDYVFIRNGMECKKQEP